MKPAPFEYLRPENLEVCLEILRQHGSEAKLLAGGQSLVPAMNFRLAQPGLLVDLNRLAELDYLSPNEFGGMRIGSMTRHSRLETDPTVARLAPLLAETMPHIAHQQIRNRGTLGGSLAHADPAAELPVIAIALEARFLLRSAGGERWVEAGEFFQGMFSTLLTSEEVLVEVELPPMKARTGWSFMEVAPRQGDYAMMGVAVLITLDESQAVEDARLVYLNAGDGPVDARQAAQALMGRHPSEEVFKEAAAIASESEIDPMGNVHATPNYQRHLARALTRQALDQAARRARREVDV